MSVTLTDHISSDGETGMIPAQRLGLTLEFVIFDLLILSPGSASMSLTLADHTSMQAR